LKEKIRKDIYAKRSLRRNLEEEKMAEAERHTAKNSRGGKEGREGRPGKKHVTS